MGTITVEPEEEDPEEEPAEDPGEDVDPEDPDEDTLLEGESGTTEDGGGTGSFTGTSSSPPGFFPLFGYKASSVLAVSLSLETTSVSDLISISV